MKTWRRGPAFVAAWLSLAVPGPAAADGFSSWLQAFRAEAASVGISAATLDRALGGIRPVARVIELDRKQPEGTTSFSDYLERVVSDKRVGDGRRLKEEHRAALLEASRRFGVPSSIILALWGIESTYGAYKGDYPVVDSLATLAFDGRRSAYFRQELLNALRILDRGEAPSGDLRGSWAGAMGQVQFMPTSFLNYAVDGDGDGRKDIWATPADIFASAANYLAAAGWRPGEPWGRAVRLPRGFDPALGGSKVTKPVAEWHRLGVRERDGRPIAAAADATASIIMPDGAEGPTFIAFHNFHVLLRWNRSSYFATAVGTLSDRIGDE